MMKHLFLLIAIMLFDFTIKAQDANFKIKTKKDSVHHYNKHWFQTAFGGNEYASVTYNKLNLNRFDNYLVGRNNTAPKSPTYAINAAITLFLFEPIIGYEGQVFIGQSTSYHWQNSNVNYDQKVAIGGGYVLVNMGGSIFSNKHIVIYPLAGIGYAALHAINELTAVDANKNVLINNINQKYINHSFMLNPKVCINFFNEKDMLVGFNIGYNNIIGHKWKLNGYKIPDTQSSGLNGFYVGLIFGHGGTSQTKGRPIKL